MTDAGLSIGDRRTLMIGAIAIASLVSLTRGLPALLRWQRETVIAATTVATDHAEARAGSRELPALRDSLHARRRRIALLDSTLITAPTPAAATAVLASAVNDLARDTRVRIAATQLRSDSTTTAGVARAGVRVSGIADVRGITAFLRAIELDDALLVAKELSITQPEPAASDGKPEMLRFELVVECMARIR
jgi:hypothetical protein